MISEKCPGLTVVSDDKVASSVKILTNINYMSELCVRTRPIYVVSFPFHIESYAVEIRVVKPER